jgi:hypothetical protein
MSLPALKALMTGADEKRAALEKLSEMVERILNPLPSNVETLDDPRARSRA